MQIIFGCEHFRLKMEFAFKASSSRLEFTASLNLWFSWKKEYYDIRIFNWTIMILIFMLCSREARSKNANQNFEFYFPRAWGERKNFDGYRSSEAKGKFFLFTFSDSQWNAMTWYFTRSWILMVCTDGRVFVELEKVFLKLFECKHEIWPLAIFTDHLRKFRHKKMCRKIIKQNFSCVNFNVSASCLGSFVFVLLPCI